jgi:hypothetical protein
MQGLRTQENDKFLKFWDLVQTAAKEKNAIFFLDTGEGHDFETPDMEGECLSGWLVPVSRSAEFEKDWMKGSEFVPPEFSDICLIAKWEIIDNSISIRFVEDVTG